MSAKTQPATAEPVVEPLLLAAADCRAAAANLREVTEVLLAEHAGLLAEVDALRASLAQHKSALTLAMRLAGITTDTADSDGKETTDVH